MSCLPVDLEDYPPCIYDINVMLKDDLNKMKVLQNSGTLRNSISTMDNIIISPESNNLFQINRWLAYEIDDAQLYDRIIEDES